MRASGLELPIVTARLVLRALVATDRDALAAWERDERVRRHVPHPSRALAALERLTATPRTRSRARRSWELAVVVRRSGQLIGACDLARCGPRQADIGYLLAPRHWGFGYGSELAAALVAAAFRGLGLERISAVVAIENERSRRVLEKAGLRWEGLMRRHARAGGRWWDCHLYVIDRTLWQSRHGAAACAGRSGTR